MNQATIKRWNAMMCLRTTLITLFDKLYSIFFVKNQFKKKGQESLPSRSMVGGLEL